MNFKYIVCGFTLIVTASCWTMENPRETYRELYKEHRDKVALSIYVGHKLIKQAGLVSDQGHYIHVHGCIINKYAAKKNLDGDYLHKVMKDAAAEGCTICEKTLPGFEKWLSQK